MITLFSMNCDYYQYFFMLSFFLSSILIQITVCGGDETSFGQSANKVTTVSDEEDVRATVGSNIKQVEEQLDTEETLLELNKDVKYTLDKLSELIIWSRKILDKMFKKSSNLEVNHHISKPEQNAYLATKGEKPTFEEHKGDVLYRDAMTILNSSNRTKDEGYAVLVEASDAGHSKAKLKVGWAMLLGTNLPQNIAKARDIFSELSDTGLPDAHMGMGLLYAAGLSVKPSPAKALIHYIMAAIGGNIWARMALGYRYWSGISLKNNCEKSLEYYRLVANAVANEVQLSGGTVIQRVRLLDEIDIPGYDVGVLHKDLIEYYQLLAEKGDVQAQVGLGQLHYHGGRGVNQDYQKALYYFLQAADAGSSLAMAFLGQMYLEGNHIVNVDNPLAYMYFKKAAYLGNPVGQSGLGMMYLEGKEVEKDYSKALKYFSQAAEQGWVDGQLQLGIMYFTGLGVRRDYKLAKKYFLLASQSGHILAFYNLAQMHATGTGVMRSCSTAVELYKNVAERGKWGTKLMVAHDHYRNRKYEEAFVHYVLLSELGYEVAQSNAAFMLDNGDLQTAGIDKTEAYVRAFVYWGRSAMQGSSAAQVKLGDYYYYGLGTPTDYEQAVFHYKTAAVQHKNAQAMFNLGYMHEHGLGITQDIYLAKRSYDMAADASADAKIPVYLALFKLNFMSNYKYIAESILYELNNFHVFDLATIWDVYILTLLFGLLGFFFFFRCNLAWR